jgi:hypothetical protein
MSKRPISLDKMVFPAGRKRGAILESTSPRKARAKVADRCDPIRRADGFHLIPSDQWDRYADTPAHLNKRNRYPWLLDQDGIGSCGSESKEYTMRALWDEMNQPSWFPNPLGTYNTVSGGVDRGSVIGHNVEFARDVGCFPEEVWPRSKGFRAKPSAFAVEVAGFFRLIEFFHVETIEEFVSALLQGWFIHAGYSGHAISFFRYAKKGILHYINSWGNWGQNGVGSLSADKVYFGYGAYAYRTACLYYRPETDQWGNWRDGVWVDCPWRPSVNQALLAKAVNRYQYNLVRRTAKGMPKLTEVGSEHLYKTTLAKLGLAV